MKAGIMGLNGSAGEYAGWEGPQVWKRAIEIADVAERLGFNYIWVPDHLMGVLEVEDAPVLEAYTLLGAMAARTDRVRLGAGVTCASFRNPALLARMLTTLDLASGGRVDCTLGAGWHEGEFLGYGFGYPPIRERLRMLEDALEIVTRMQQPGRATWQGSYCSVHNAAAEPKSLQKPRIPLIVGGNGQNVTWRLAARYADELNFDHASLKQIRSWLPIVRQRCEEENRDPATLPVSVLYWWKGITGPRRVEQLQEMAELGVVRTSSVLMEAVDSDEPLISFAEDCRKAGLELHSARSA